MEKTLKLKILNTAVDLLVEEESFYTYLKSILEGYMSSADGDPDIISRFRWQEELVRKNTLKLDKRPGYVNIGPNIAMALEAKHLEFLKKIHGRRFKTSFILSGQRIKQDLYCHKKKLKDLVARLKQRPQHLDFFEIAYFLFYYPLFWFLENHRAIYPMHASCVDTPKGGIIIAGLPGSGKSVTSLALWKRHKDNGFISDNIIFYDRENIYACPEPIRLHGEAKGLVGEDRLIRIDNARKKSDKGFYIVKDRGPERSRPSIFLLVRLSEKYSLDEVDPSLAVSMVANQNLQGAEILDYYEYASLVSFLAPQKNIFKERIEALETLFKKIRCFTLNIPCNREIDSTVGSILELL